MSEQDEVVAPDEAPTVDPQVPEPRGLSTYIQLLGEWTKGTVSEPFLLGLIRSQGFGDAEREAFLAGADALWGLVPPIQAPEVAEAEMEPTAARALGLALVLRGEHALHHFLPSAPTPRVLKDVAEMITVIHLILEGDDGPNVADKRLAKLQARLSERKVNTSRLADRKEDVRGAVLARRRQEEEEERARARAERDAEEAAEKKRQRRRSSGRTDVPIKALLFMIASIFGSIWIFNTLTPKPSGGLPPATAYTEVSVLSIIRHPDIIYIRVKPEWLTLGEAERKVGAQRLFDRLSKESGGAVVRIVIQTGVGEDLAVVTAQSVKWRGPFVTPELPPEKRAPAPPQKEDVTEGSDR